MTGSTFAFTPSTYPPSLTLLLCGGEGERRRRRRVWLFSVIMDLSFVLIKEQACCALSMPLITGKRGEVHYKYSKAYIIQTQTCYSGSHLKRHLVPLASFGRKWCGLFISRGRNCAFTKVKELASVTNVKFRSKKVTNTLEVVLS